MEEWKTYKYTELCTLVGGGTPKTTVPEYWDGNIPWLSVKDFGGGKKYVYTTEKTITELGLKNSTTKLLEKDDIIISARGTIGEIAMIPSDMAFNQSCFGIRAKADLIDPHYLYYLTKTKVAELKKASHGSVFDTITRDTFDGISCELPDLNTQKQVSQLLSSIDNKIELNNRINHNLEEQAQALYKSWFVDFEPFKNGKFIDSELGLIPEGWKIGKINDVINLLSGFPFKSSAFQENGDYQLITIKGVQDGYLDVTSADMLSSLPSKMPQYCILNIGDILISLTGNVGRICIVDRKNLLLNQRVAILSPKNIRDSFYVYTMFRSESMKNELIHIARGTAQLNLSPIETGEKLTVIPPDSILEAFAKVGKGTFNQYISLKMENIRLMEIRDSLLPKLMSGELKINDLTC